MFTENEKAVLEQASSIIESKLKNEVAITSIDAAEKMFSFKLAGSEREVFSVAFLNTKHSLIEYKELFFGTVDGARVYPREIAREALALNAKAVIIAHNHPSGHSTPSNDDRRITKEIVTVLKLFDINVLDHFIVGFNESFSFARNGWI